MRSLSRLVVVVALLVSAPFVLASGFHVYEQGGKASGQAVAFIARADDASAMYYNPAAIAKFDTPRAMAGFSLAFLGGTDFTAGPLGPELAAASPFGSAGFPRLFDTGKIDMLDNTPIPPHAAYAQRIGDSRYYIGFFVGAPFGLVTEWGPEAYTRYAAVKADLRVVDVAINGAVDFGGGWSGSLGIDYVMASLRDFSRDQFIPVSPAPGITYFVDTRSNLKGDGNDWGWNGAVHFKNKDWAFGAVYRSKIDISADIDATFDPLRMYTFVAPETDLPPTSGIGLISIPFNDAIAAGVRGQLPSGPATGDLRLPATYGLGLAYLGLDKWEFELDVNRIEWSHFDKIPLDFKNNTSVLTDTAVIENWEDTTSIRFGMAYSINDMHQLRLGGYVEDSAIPTKTLRPSVPDSDRTALTLGYGLTWGKISFDLYWLHIMTDEITVGLADRDLATPGPTPTERARYLISLVSEQSRVGKYESTIDLVGLTASYKF